MRALLCLILAANFYSFGYTQTGNILFDNSIVHEIYLDFDSSDFWETLQNEYSQAQQFSGSDIPYLMAKATIDGFEIDSIGVRLKGKSSYYYVADKKPIKLDFNKFVDGKNYDGLKKINLHNGIGDPTMLRDYLGYNLMRAGGVMAPRVSFARIYLNGQYWGLYEVTEQIDKTFLEENFAGGKGNLFKNQRWSNLEYWGNDPAIYKDTFELKTNTEEDDWSGFIHFLDVLNNSSDAAFPDAIQSIFNVDQYLHVLAVDVMTNNWDSYIDNRRNFYLYEEPKSGKFHWIPWDYNLSMGGDLETGGNPYPPYAEDCLIKTDFTYTQIGTTVTFTGFSEPMANGWHWDFGDGQTSGEQNPVHTFSDNDSQDKIYVCLNSSRIENGNTCEQKRCIPIDLSADPEQCFTIQNQMVPYSAEDPIFQQVIAEDDYCCSDSWDVFCEIKYFEIQQNGTENTIETGTNYTDDYELVQDNPEKVLIYRLLQVPEFKNRYLDIACVLRESFFNAEKLFPQIDYFANLIRESVYDDPNYIYTHDYFEYAVGNGSGGGPEAEIPALKYFFNQRFPQLEEDFMQENQICSDALAQLQWGDVTINEIVAASDEAGILDPADEPEDWIELFNNTPTPIDLTGYYLKDNATTAKRWRFPNGTTIPANDYLIIWADKDTGQEGLHANFKLDADGEFLLLAHADGTWIDQISFPSQLINTAFARVPNGTGDFRYQAPTFKLNNENTTKITQKEFNDNLSFYPNPWSDHLVVSLSPGSHSLIQNVELISTTGQQIKINTEINEEYLKLDLVTVSMPSGVYFLKIIFAQDSKIIKTSYQHK